MAKPHSRLFLLCEWVALFLVLPTLIFLHPTRLDVPLALWSMTVYAAVALTRDPEFSWTKNWRGDVLGRRDLAMITLRYVVSTLGIVLLTNLLKPDRLFGFPHERPAFWLVVMLLYPVLSALPQEIVFRSFFFHRYKALFPLGWALPVVSAFCFGLIHIVFHNPVAPILSFVCGLFLGSSYLAHKSLKKVAIEHALYGDMLFTIGLGLYFFVHP